MVSPAIIYSYHISLTRNIACLSDKVLRSSPGLVTIFFWLIQEYKFFYGRESGIRLHILIWICFTAYYTFVLPVELITAYQFGLVYSAIFTASILSSICSNRHQQYSSYDLAGFGEPNSIRMSRIKRFDFISLATFLSWIPQYPNGLLSGDLRDPSHSTSTPH